jgi:hypothetical protein
MTKPTSKIAPIKGRFENLQALLAHVAEEDGLSQIISTLRSTAVPTFSFSR